MNIESKQQILDRRKEIEQELEEMPKETGSDFSFNAGATLGPVNETNMTRIWNKHKQTNIPLKRKVFVGMSGGVDSSVAAYLLKKRGLDVVGVFLRCYNIDGCAERDAEDARRVAEKLKIPFYVWDFEKEYKERVVEYMVEGYRAGLTPNPDVACNREVKFGLFLDRALKLGADYVATGHYVRLRRGAEMRNEKGERSSPHISSLTSHIYIAKDDNKDQSYFLWAVPQAKLKKCLFPIGGYLKPEVRAIARKAGLPTAEKKDSQGICFLGKVTIADFLKSYIPAKKGVVLATDGRVIGEHDGAWFYTIGQRHVGIKYQVSGVKAGADVPRRYVAAKNAKTNTLVVAEGAEHESLYRKEICLAGLNFLAPKPKKPVTVYARVRYRQPLGKAVLRVRQTVRSLRPTKPVRSSKRSGSTSRTSSSSNIEQFELIFAKPQKFVAEGQSAVFYDRRGRMLGGGVIIA
ncbi:MAG: tRNA 2-thiouridine(34) synthase MnmA [Patescibacteria group bacterium]